MMYDSGRWQATAARVAATGLAVWCLQGILATTAVAQGAPPPNAGVMAVPNPPVPLPAPIYRAPPARLPDNAPLPPTVTPIPVPTPSLEPPIEEASLSVLDQALTWWRVLLNRVGIDNSAPSPDETRQMAATARDPSTGLIRLESAAMYCAIECQAQVDQRINLCLRNASDTALRAAGVEDRRNCVPESVGKYEACLAGCGLPETRPRPLPVRTPVMPVRRGPHTPKPAAAAATGGAK